MIELLFFLIFLSGLVMKLIHMPGHTIVMGVGLLAMLIFYVVSLVTSTSGNRRTASWLGLSTVSWLIFFLAEVKFMGGTLILMMLALFVSVLSLLMTLREPGVLSPGRIFVLLAALFLSASTSWMELHTRYYVFNIHFSETVWNDYVTLDKYSWFLYKDRRFEEALVINSKAYDAAKANGAEEYIPTVEEHQQAIIKRNWGSFEID
jgi:hypothetical protein